MTSRPPGPASRREEALEANIRLKLAKREPLTPSERRYFADAPGRRELTPADVQRMYGVAQHAHGPVPPAPEVRAARRPFAWWRRGAPSRH